jgi:hypothetical protein
MILEALFRATQRAGSYARASGVAAEQAAIVGRFLRCRGAWRPHLERCRAFVRAAAEETPRSERVVVLGSGPLLDIPLAALARRFREVVLVDAAQPLHARLLAWRLGNVAAYPLSMVVVEGDRPVYRSWRHATGTADLVVASMLLSQLPPPRAPDAGAAWSRDLVAAALADLQAGNEAVCLITETARRIERPGAPARIEDPLYGVSPPQACATWEWQLAPPGERADGKRIVLGIAACLRPGGCNAWASVTRA